MINAPTASAIRGVRLSPVAETDRAGVLVTLSTIGVIDIETDRVLRTADTMHLHRSSALIEAAHEREVLRAVKEPTSIEFEDEQFAAPPLLK